MQAKRSINKWVKVFIGVTVVLAVVNVVDYSFYGRQTHNILGALGFTLMALGIFKDNTSCGESEVNTREIRFWGYAVIASVLLILASFALKWFA